MKNVLLQGGTRYLQIVINELYVTLISNVSVSKEGCIYFFFVNDESFSVESSQFALRVKSLRVFLCCSKPKTL